MTKQNLITIPEIANKFNADESQIRKVIKSAKIPFCRVIRSETHKSATAIYLSDLPKLKKAMPSLNIDVADKGDVSISTVAQELQKLRGWKTPDVSTVLKMANAKGYKLHIAKIGNRPVKCFSKSDYTKFMKEARDVAVA